MKSIVHEQVYSPHYTWDLKVSSSSASDGYDMYGRLLWSCISQEEINTLKSAWLRSHKQVSKKESIGMTREWRISRHASGGRCVEVALQSMV